jgi:hypothetical protein
MKWFNKKVLQLKTGHKSGVLDIIQGASVNGVILKRHEQ